MLSHFEAWLGAAAGNFEATVCWDCLNMGFINVISRRAAIMKTIIR